MTRDKLIEAIASRLYALDASRLQKVLNLTDRLYNNQIRKAG